MPARIATLFLFFIAGALAVSAEPPVPPHDLEMATAVVRCTAYTSGQFAGEVWTSLRVSGTHERSEFGEGVGTAVHRESPEETCLVLDATMRAIVEEAGCAIGPVRNNLDDDDRWSLNTNLPFVCKERRAKLLSTIGELADEMLAFLGEDAAAGFPSSTPHVAPTPVTWVDMIDGRFECTPFPYGQYEGQARAALFFSPTVGGGLYGRAVHSWLIRDDPIAVCTALAARMKEKTEAVGCITGGNEYPTNVHNALPVQFPYACSGRRPEVVSKLYEISVELFTALKSEPATR
jgi:hypothetical protein